MIYGADTKVVEIGNTKAADEEFQKTVQGLDQKFSLVPDNVKEAYLVHIIKEAKLRKQ